VDLNIQVSDRFWGGTGVPGRGAGPRHGAFFWKALDHLCEKARPVMVDLRGSPGSTDWASVFSFKPSVCSSARLRPDHRGAATGCPEGHVRERCRGLHADLPDP